MLQIRGVTCIYFLARMGLKAKQSTASVASREELTLGSAADTSVIAMCAGGGGRREGTGQEATLAAITVHVIQEDGASSFHESCHAVGNSI